MTAKELIGKFGDWSCSLCTSEGVGVRPMFRWELWRGKDDINIDAVVSGETYLHGQMAAKGVKLFQFIEVVTLADHVAGLLARGESIDSIKRVIRDYKHST